jgi:DNA-binding transcriptional LysR family regulator
MQSLRSLIASPSGLFAFEAAARLRSFTAAGRELNVTQAAISFAVKQLEEALGVALFLRHHKKIELTDVGERFFHDVALGLNVIRRSAEELNRQRRDGHVTLSVSTGFATYWMMPRLGAFRAAHPAIELRLLTSDKDVDLLAEGIDLGIRRGDGKWPDCGAALLAPEEIYPVCSPGYRPKQRGLAPSALVGLELIHLEEPFRPRPTWTDWLRENGHDWHDAGAGLRLNDYALVLQAAVEGEGLALGWHHLVSGPVLRGRLIRPSPATLVTGLGIWVTWPKRTPLTPAALAVRDWLIADRSADAGEGAPRPRRRRASAGRPFRK